jgi:hypothetical protein
MRGATRDVRFGPRADIRGAKSHVRFSSFFGVVSSVKRVAPGGVCMMPSFFVPPVFMMSSQRAYPLEKADPANCRQLSGPAVTRADDLWQLGKHRLLCGDARKPQHLTRLMGGEPAHMAFLDPRITCECAILSAAARPNTKNLPWLQARWRRPFLRTF